MPKLSRILIANRGEIAVRVARACHDSGIAAIAVYSEDDRDSMHVRISDEAFSLNGTSAAETYLDIDKLIGIALRSGADGVHPGYGFLAESSQFAQAVIDAGLTWIGPSPEAIEALGDKVTARHIAAKVGAPLVAGTQDPVANAQEILDFVDLHGLPVAIKAAYGGGGRGLKVARTREEVPELFDSATREAVTAFGRGECFVEQYLDNPRHVETQCLADSHGNVAVISTRDCSLQRRHQKLVEEAPAPFLTDDQHRLLVDASIAILKEAEYQGAATCEFLLSTDGRISFLEVNTRLQVEHPVTEEVSGVDLVREQFRIAEGEELGYSEVPSLGHAIEFRINGEDPRNNFLPSPGLIKSLRMPGGPGVRNDFGVEVGDRLSGNFDSMLGKIVIYGATRAQAIERARRALSELKIMGIATVLPFHRAVLEQDAFTAEQGRFRVHTRWIETDFAKTFAGSLSGAASMDSADDREETAPPERVVVEVGGKRLEVVLPAGLAAAGRPSRRATGAPHRAKRTGSAKVSTDAVTAPMQGAIVKVHVSDGEHVNEGDLLMVLEAMKMEQPITAPTSGTVRDLTAQEGASVTAGQPLCRIE